MLPINKMVKIPIIGEIKDGKVVFYTTQKNCLVKSEKRAKNKAHMTIHRSR